MLLQPVAVQLKTQQHQLQFTWTVVCCLWIPLTLIPALQPRSNRLNLQQTLLASHGQPTLGTDETVLGDQVAQPCFQLSLAPTSPQGHGDRLDRHMAVIVRAIVIVTDNMIAIVSMIIAVIDIVMIELVMVVTVCVILGVVIADVVVLVPAAGLCR